MKKIKNDLKYLKKKGISLNDHKKKLALSKLLKSTILKKEILVDNLNLFFDRRLLSRILNFNELYNKQLNLSGNIALFGVYYGRDLINLLHLSQIYQPYNFAKKIYAFDTFKGIENSKIKYDGNINDFNYSVPKNYEKYLEKICTIQELYWPVEHQQIEIIKGNVKKTLPNLLKKRKDLFFSMIYFDLDVYQPTYASLMRLKPYLNEGCVLAFDQFNHQDWPGETLAIKEFFKKTNKKFKIKYSKFKPQCSYFIYE
tara:strand:- start:788 stop:1555 length:768 start_codon:yes stop_codon:yes gene_type:complete